ncbi:MAG: AAA family ATPase [Mariprofundaceae bacterium]
MKHDCIQTVIAVANQKGGVGKTTTSINLAAALATLDKRVLLLDVDPQGNSSTGLGIDKQTIEHHMYSVLMGECTLEQAIHPTSCSNLFVVPTTMDLAGAEVELVDVLDREKALTRALAGYRGEGFDYVFIDCPPSLSLLTINALALADRILITLQTEFYAMEGLSQLIETIRRVRRGLNPHLVMDGILLTMVDRRNNLAVQVEQEVREFFGQQVYTQIIPRNIRLSEAPSFGVSVLHHDIRSSGARAYLSVAQEMMRREQMHEVTT